MKQNKQKTFIGHPKGKQVENIPKISFCIPSKSNVRYLKSCIPAIRENSYRKDHDILIWVDEDTDGTVEWLKSLSNDKNIKYFVNKSNELYGIGSAYDKLIRSAKTDVVMVYHADMILGKNADYEAYKHLTKKGFVCSTRIEPPLHPEEPCKIVEDLGLWPEDNVKDGFKKQLFNDTVKNLQDEYKDKITNGMFAPWMVYKKDLLNIGGHDPMLKSAREDSDIFNRFILNGFSVIQSWTSYVYHLTCRAGQFQNAEKTEDLQHKSTEWSALMRNSTRDFIRKWGGVVCNDKFLHPVIKPKYNIAYIIKNCSNELLYQLEPWTDYILVDFNPFNYIVKENSRSGYNISHKVGYGKTIRSKVIKDHNIVIEFDGKQLKTQEQFNQITKDLSDIITSVNDSSDIGNGVEFEWDIFHMLIKSFKTYENENIINTKIKQ